MKIMMTALSALLLLLAFCWQPADAADKVDNRALGKAWRKAEQALKDDKWPMDDTVDRLGAVGGLLDYETALRMLAYFEECDTAWGGGETNRLGRKGKGKRPPEAYKLAAAILDTVRDMEISTEAMKFAEEGDIEDYEKYPLRIRMAMIDAIVNCVDDEAVQTWLVNYAKNTDGNPDMRILVVRALNEVSDDSAVFLALLQCLSDPSWRIREVAVEAMVDVADEDEDKAIITLIDRLSQENGRLRKTIGDALESITGEDHGTNSDKWVDWFKAKRRADAGLPAKKAGKHRGSEVIFKTETFSNRYVFVLDTSVSMTRAMKADEKEAIKESMKQDEDDKRELLPWAKISSRADLAREEIIRSLKVMDPEVTKFTIVAFDEEIKVWKEELMDATSKNIKTAASWLRGIKGGKKTDVFGSIDAVYDLCEKISGEGNGKRKKKKSKKKKRVITGEKHVDDGLPDTVFLYTDGYATHGKYAGRDKEWQAKKMSQKDQAKLYSKMMNDMVIEIADRNRVSRLTINCIGVGTGNRPPDSRTLGRISSKTDGKYRNINK